MRLRVATTNPGKLREFREILAPRGFELAGIDDLAGLRLEESGATFEENAVIKARAVCERSGEATVADDSGLEVDALHGAPGVHSARYAGVTGPEQDAANRRKLLAALASVPDGRRTARFVCALAYCAPRQPPQIFRGTVAGRIGRTEHGSNGFGYDAIFVLAEHGRTVAQLDSDSKNLISHRGRALAQLVAFLSR
ncbi:MAG: RdgB/HAM1 family non-canonical purine NTP pyrophosphatase [Deltaproteobacteria bacterium]|nr:RdgB/HAM1 family non-canonical purine NTP pyrophosphatase [Deltaproteobacteria bacterium]